MKQERDVSFEIVEHLGVINQYDTGWAKELNRVSWNGQQAKYDIRDWDEDHARMSRGVTLTDWDMKKVVELYHAKNSREAVNRTRVAEEERRARMDNTPRHQFAVSMSEAASDSADEIKNGTELGSAAGSNGADQLEETAV